MRGVPNLLSLKALSEALLVSVVCVQTLFSVVRVQTSLLRLALHIGVVRELALLVRVQTSLLCLAPHIGVV
jgi:hypothetical protein